MNATSKTVVAMRDNPAGPETLFAAPSSDTAPEAAGTSGRHAFVPLLLALAALLSWMGFQAWQLTQERQQLQAVQANQAPALVRAAQLRQRLDLLAADTQRLADTGNANAQQLVDRLREHGVTIQPAAAAPTVPTTPAAPTSRP
jgi:uncharacterized protein HemX